MLRNKNYLYGDNSKSMPTKENFGDYILKKLVEYGDDIALINANTDEKITYAEIAQQAINFAVSLVRYGVRKGDVIAIISENRQEYFSTFIGIACAGATVNGVNQLYTKDEILHALKLSQPNYVVCSPYALNTHEETLKTVKSIKKIIIYGDEKYPDTLSYNDFVIPIGDEENDRKGDQIQRLKTNVRYEEFVTVDVRSESDVLVMLYSSGTTGLSKGVMITHHNVLTLCSCHAVDLLDGIILSVGPWFHVMGLMGIMFGLTTHKSFAYLSKFDMDLYLRTIEKYKVTMMFLAPVVLVAILKMDVKYDLSSVRGIVSGSAPLHEDVVKNVLPKFPNIIGILMGYGMTETCLTITSHRFTDKSVINTGSIGTVLPHNVIKIVDENEQPLGAYQNGELRVKGPTVMKGYVGGDNSLAFDSEGFFKTGDIGYYDDRGHLYIVDRLKELIKYKGHQVPPAELEALLLQHDAVQEVGVVGLKDPQADELPMAFVVLQPGKTVTEKELQEYVAKRVSNPKHLRGGVQFVSQIPRNTTGKIIRKALQELAIKTRTVS